MVSLVLLIIKQKILIAPLSKGLVFLYHPDYFSLFAISLFDLIAA